MSRNDPLAEAARQFGRATAMADPTGELTYSRLDQLVAERADAFRAKRSLTRRPIAILARSQPQTQMIIDLWALWRCGASVALLNPRWPAAALDDAIDLVGAERFDMPAESPRLARSPEAGGAHPAVNASTQLRPKPLSSPRTILFSSGSTGTPKAIAHQLDAHLASAEGANQNVPLSPGDRWLLTLPLFHVSGLGILFRCTIAGATIVVPEESLSLREQIRQTRPTHVSLVPTQLIRLLDESADVPEGLRAVLLGGGPLPMGVLSAAHAAGWPLATTYGLSETASQVTATAAGAALEELQSAGRVLAGREVKIDADGQILVRGATLFDGYVHAQQVVSATDKDGWFATGDLGHWDDRGRLVVAGRRDNMFISGGENIYPERIERAMLGLPGVRQVIVVPLADRQFGHRPVAFVDAHDQNETAWRQALAERLPRYEMPVHFHPWPEPAGLKPNRRHLRQLAEQLDRQGC